MLDVCTAAASGQGCLTEMPRIGAPDLFLIGAADASYAERTRLLVPLSRNPGLRLVGLLHSHARRHTLQFCTCAVHF
jgi:hypothetical protein